MNILSLISLFLTTGCGDSSDSNNHDNNEKEDFSMYCDENPSLNLIEEDSDCDGILLVEDCDDSDESVVNTNVDDVDCDLVVTSED